MMSHIAVTLVMHEGVQTDALLARLGKQLISSRLAASLLLYHKVARSNKSIQVLRFRESSPPSKHFLKQDHFCCRRLPTQAVEYLHIDTISTKFGLIARLTPTMAYVLHPWRLLHCGTPRFLTRDEFNKIRRSKTPVPGAEHGRNNHERIYYNRDAYRGTHDYRPTCQHVLNLIDEFRQLVSEATAVDPAKGTTDRFSRLLKELETHDVPIQHRPLLVSCQGDMLGSRIMLEHFITQGHHKRSLKSPLFTAKTCPTTIKFRSTLSNDSFKARLQLRTLHQLKLECSEFLFAPMGGYHEDVLPPHCKISGADVYEPMCVEVAQTLLKKLTKDANFRQGEGEDPWLDVQAQSFDEMNEAVERYMRHYEGLIDSIEVELSSPAMQLDMDIVNLPSKSQSPNLCLSLKF